MLFIHFSGDFSKETKRAMKGYYYAVQRVLKKIPFEVTFTTVDCKKRKKVCDYLGVFYYPQNRLFSASRMVRISDDLGRTHTSMTKTILKAVYGSVSKANRDSISRLRKVHDRFFFYSGNDWDSDWDLYRQIAASYKYIDWYHAHRKDGRNSAQFDEEKNRYSVAQQGPFSPLNSGTLDNFVKTYLFHLRNLTNYDMDRIFMNKGPVLILFYKDEDNDRGVMVPFEEAVKKIKHEKHVLCSQIPMKPPFMRNTIDMMKWLQVDKDIPAFRLIEKVNGRWRVYLMDKRIYTNYINKFYWEEYKEGRLVEWFKSEQYETPGVIKKVVGLTYTKQTRREKDDVVSIVYSEDNWNLSKRVIKVMEFVSRVLVRYERIKFVKILADLNGHLDIPQRGYPIVYLYKKGIVEGENPLEFGGLFTGKKICEWITRNVGVENPFDEVLGEIRNRRKMEKENIDL